MTNYDLKYEGGYLNGRRHEKGKEYDEEPGYLIFEGEYRLNKRNVLSSMEPIDTMKESIDFCAIPFLQGYKYPKLQELYLKLFRKEFSNAHNSSADTQATMECFFELKKRNIIRI